MNNRPIKFRAWVPIGGTEGFFMTDPINPFTQDARWLKQYPVMQFTGLTDKNGKEIYEGDVVRFYRHRTVENIRWETADVRWNNNGYVLGDEAIYFFGNEWSGFEVIGNIYENPELLSSPEV